MATDIGPPRDPLHVPTEAIKALYQVWSNDLRLVNDKLTQYLALQTLLLVAKERTEWGKTVWLPILGIAMSLLWGFSIGRTFAYRQKCDDKIKEIVKEHPALKDFEFKDDHPPWWGFLDSKFVQGWIPIFGLAIWAIVLIVMLLRMGVCKL